MRLQRISTRDLARSSLRATVLPEVGSREVWGTERPSSEVWTRAGCGRLRPTALLNLTTIEGAIAEAERVVAGGARAVFIQDGVAPGGYAPAAPEVDRLWALLAEAGVPATLHIGGQEGFFGSWTCPRPANTSDVGVSPRGGCSDAEEGGGQGRESPTTAIVHAVVQGRGRRLGTTG
jgi:hypothetical protein